MSHPAARRPIHANATSVRLPVYKVWAVVCLVGLLAAGCSLDNPSAFPTLGPQLTTVTTAPIGSETTAATSGPSSSDPLTLTLAVPFATEVAEALRLLFLARESGLLVQEPGQFIGQNLQLDDLRQFDGPLTLDIITVSAATGVAADQVRTWLASASLPDLVYCQSAAAVPGLDHLLDLSDLLFDQDLLSVQRVFPVASESVRFGQRFVGIPYLFSVPLIYYNQDLLDQLSSRAPTVSWTWAEWQQWLADVQQTISAAGLGLTDTDLERFQTEPDELAAHLRQAILAAENLADLLPFLPPSVAQETGWGTWNGYTFVLTDPSLHAATEWLRQIAQAGYSDHHLTEEQVQLVREQGSLRLRQRVVSWVGDSTDLAYWHQQTDLDISESLIPSGLLSDDPDSTARTARRTPVRVRCLAISRTTPQPDLAVRLACFLALDQDALLLQSRFQVYEGLFPVVREPVVWAAMVGRQPFGSRLQDVSHVMASAYGSGQQVLGSWQAVMTQALGDWGARCLASDDPELLPELLDEMAAAARSLLQGG
jgi:hypothetical protein